MSRKNRLDEKRARRMRRALRTPPRAETDLLRWLIDHGHAQTKGAAAKLIHERRVKSDSHPVGFKEIEIKDDDGTVTDTKEVFYPRVPASVRPSLQVVTAEAVASAQS